MPFGKFKGWSLTAIPLDYLRWLVSSCQALRPDQRAAVQAELSRRDEGTRDAIRQRRRRAYDATGAITPPVDSPEGRLIQALLRGEQEGRLSGPWLDQAWSALAELARRLQGRDRATPEALARALAGRN